MTRDRWSRTKRGIAAVAACALAIPVWSVTDAAAQTSRQKQIDKTLRSLREQVAEASREEAALLDEVDAAEARRRELDSVLRAMNAEVAAAEAELGIADDEFGLLQAMAFRAERRYEEARAEAREARAELRQRAVSAYMGNSNAQLAGALLRVRTPGEFERATEYAGALVEAQNRTVKRVRALREAAALAKKDAERRRDAAGTQRNIVAGNVERLERARNHQAAARKAAADHEQAQESLLSRVRSRKAEFQAQIAALQRESDSISDLIRRTGSDGITPSGKGVLLVPVSPARITSRFGPRVHPIFGDSRMHNGIDFGVPAGTPIKAAGNGTVLFAGVRGGYGNTIIVDHGKGLATLYAHQSKFAVGSGRAVKRGDVIGYVGSSGYATGPHLHFEVRANGTPVDPMRYL